MDKRTLIFYLFLFFSSFVSAQAYTAIPEQESVRDGFGRFRISSPEGVSTPAQFTYDRLPLMVHNGI